MRNKSEPGRWFCWATSDVERVRGVRCGLSGQLAEGKQAAAPVSRRVAMGRRRSGVSAARKGSDEVGRRSRLPWLRRP